MAVVYRSVNTPVGGSTATISPAPPAGIAAGDMLLMGVFSNLNNNPTVSAGWTLVDAETGGTSNARVYSRVATGSEPATYTVTQAGAENYCAVIMAWYSDTGKDLYVDAHANRANTASTNRAFAGVTTTKASAGLACFANLDSAVSTTSDAAMLEKIDQLVGLGNQIYLMTQVLTALGPTGTRTATGGSTAATRTVTVAVAELLPPDGAPTGLSITAVSTSQINLSWADNASNETGYKVYHSTTGSGFTVLATLATNSVSHSHTGLTEHSIHYYYVTAYNGDGESAPTSTQNTTTLIAPPSGLAAAPALSTVINLSWSNNSSLSTTIKVEQSNNGTTGWSEVLTTASNATTAAITGLPANTIKYFRIRAAISGDRSVYSSNASATTYAALTAPTNLVASVVNPHTVRLFWVDADLAVTNYSLERSDNGGAYAVIATPSSATYLDDDVLPENSYAYRVRAARTG